MRKVTKGSVVMKLWDLGGQARFRAMWERYCRGVNAIVFVLDAADIGKIPAARTELHTLLDKPQLVNIPILVLGNKNDLPGALSVEEIIDQILAGSALSPASAGEPTASGDLEHPLQLLVSRGDSEAAHSPSRSPSQPRSQSRIEPTLSQPPAVAPEDLRVSFAAVVLFSVIGVLLRMALNVMGTYDDAPVFGQLWAQVLGCFLFGAAQGARSEISQISPSLYVGLTTGLCGTLTTFSSFVLSTFEALAGSTTLALRTDSTGFAFRNVVSALGFLIVTFSGALASLQLGGSVVGAWNEGKQKQKAVQGAHEESRQQRNAESGITTRMAHGTIAVGAMGVYLTAVCVTAIAARDEDAYEQLLGWGSACVLAPAGSVLRWILGRWLNGGAVSRNLGFPLGTFVANVLGTTVRGVAAAVVADFGGSGQESTAAVVVSAVVGNGIGDGFTGGLTTLSTMAMELQGMRVGAASKYAAWSVVCGIVGICVIGVGVGVGVGPST
ncbi:hypothetical protein HDU83_008076 [Entophlyctis luteolus]|nr:hypothetical protein HDU83_008076 [Entophlyctis luteolus]